MPPSDLHLTIDFETRSRADIRRGAWYYAKDPSTQIMVLAFKVNDEEPRLLIPPQFEAFLPGGHGLPVETPETLAYLIANATSIEAHNAEFENAVWTECVPGTWPTLPPTLPLDKLRCSAAKAAACALPRSLDRACEVLKVPAQKDKLGYAIMRKFCSPIKTRRKVNGAWNTTESWHWNVDDYVKLCRYCLQDCEAERELSKALPNLPAFEQRLWKVDQQMNARGLRIDVPVVKDLVRSVKQTEDRLLAEWQKLTRYTVKSPRQVDATIQFVKKQYGVELDNLQKQTVVDELDELENDDWLARSTDPEYVRLLQIRQQLSKSSTSKLTAMLNHICRDERIRSPLMFNGAGTGRWTAKGVQFQNFPSRGLAIDSEHYIAEAERAFELARRGMMDAMYDDPLAVVSSCLRGLIIPAVGSRFLCADFSAIEGRVLAWASGEDYVTKAYEEGMRMYCVAAAGVYKLPYDEIFKNRKHDPYKKMDLVGKVIDLACGYQGAEGAFANMARNYGLQLPVDEVRKAIRDWRESRPMTVALWKGLERMMFEAVASPGTLQSFRGLKAKVIGKWLMMKLPSGRYLYYFEPQIVNKLMPWKDDDGNDCYKECVSYWAVDSQTKRWMQFFGYGGLWTENAVQAIARDLMAHGMVNLDDHGYPIVVTIHDEVLAERRIGEGSLDEFIALLCRAPAWADGCPITAAGWEAHRYQKD